MTRRLFIGWGVALFVCGAALCFVPLLNLLAFEFAFALCLPVSIMAAHFGIRARRTGLSPVRAWQRAIGPALAVAMVPLIPICLNALRVRNCDFGEGFLMYAAFPGISVLIATGWGAALGGLRRAGWAFAGVFIVSLLLALGRFWIHPPVDLYHPFMGYYPGSIYDEVIDLGGRLIWSRLEDLAWVSLAVALASRNLRAGLVTAVGVGGAFWMARTHDVHRDADYIQAALGGHTVTEHAHIYHPRRWSPEKATALASDVEFAWHRLAKFTGKAPSEPVQVYFYDNQRSKKRLMGAGRTRIAKPWQRTVHLHAPRVGQPVLTHELAHVFSAEISNAPHHLSLYRGVLPNMGLIEGFAVAATWEGGRLDPDQWSAALQRINLAPPVEDLLAPHGFLGSYSRTAYTLCGSFVRFVHTRDGAAAVEAGYRESRFADLDGLSAAWRAKLAKIQLDEPILAHARSRFDRPAIFRKVCAHEIAALRKATEKALKAGDREAALAHVETLLGHVARDVSARLQRIALLFALDRTDEAKSAAEAIQADKKAGAVARVRADEWLADLLATTDKPAAAAAYAALRMATFDRGTQRRLAVKSAAIDRGDEGRVVFDLLLSKTTDDDARDALYETLATSDWSVAQYLVARWHAADDRRSDALITLDRIRGVLPDAALNFEVERLRAALYFTDGRYGLAAAAYAQLTDRQGLDIRNGERESLRIWAERARFFAHRSEESHD